MDSVHIYWDTVSERQKCMYGRQKSVVGTLMSPRAGRQNNLGSIPSKDEKCFTSARASTPVLGCTQFGVQCFHRAISPGVRRPGWNSTASLHIVLVVSVSNLQPFICVHSVRRNKFTFAFAACLSFPAWFQALWRFATRYWCLVLFVNMLVSITSYSSTLYAFSALVLHSRGTCNQWNELLIGIQEKGLKPFPSRVPNRKIPIPIGSSVPNAKFRITR
jgi:hypothetical protein